MLSVFGADLIKGFEALRLNAYRDAAGLSTIGWGHRRGAGDPSTITEAEAEALFQQDAAIAESHVDRCVIVPLTQSQRDALISLVFNWGGGNFCKSILLTRLNNGDYQGAAARLREHPITAGGVVLQGLVTRRAAEADLFAAEVQAPGPIVIYPPIPIDQEPGVGEDSFSQTEIMIMLGGGLVLLFLVLR